MLDNVTINAHSSIRIEEGKVLYFDPFHISDATNDADIVFVTHDHYDHFSPEDISKVMKDDTVFVAPVVTAKLIAETFANVPSERIVTVAAGEKLDVLGIPVEVIASYNPKKQFHPLEKGYVGYVVTLDGTRFYICGDMDVTEEGKAVKCDVLMPPIGGTYTMDAHEAIELVSAIRPKYAIPTHYGDIVGNIRDGKRFTKWVEDLGIGTEVILKI